MTDKTSTNEDIGLELLKDAEKFNNATLEPYKKLVILALKTNNIGIQQLVHATIQKELPLLTGKNFHSTKVSCAILDSLFTNLSAIYNLPEENNNPYSPIDLPYTVPFDFNKKVTVDKIKERVKKLRYHVPSEYKFKVKTLLVNTVNSNEKIPDNLLFNIYKFMADHTTANEKKTTNSKRKEDSESILELLFTEVKKIDMYSLGSKTPEK